MWNSATRSRSERPPAARTGRTGLALAAAALAAAALLTGAEGDKGLKPFAKRFKVSSVDARSDAKLRRIAIKEPGYEVLYHAEKTKFFVHRSVPLRELKKAAPLQVLGRLHESVRDKDRSTTPLITDVAFLGGGSEFKPPPLEAESGFVGWHKGELQEPVAPFHLRIDGDRYRITGDEKLTAYWVEKASPESVAGETVFLRGNSKKVVVERNGKETLTRIYATEVHVLHLNPEHARVFQLQWVERKGKESVKAKEKGAAPAGPGTAGTGTGKAN